jgi:gluconolactonase
VVMTAVVIVVAPACSRARVVRIEPELDAAISADARPELLRGDYFGATEGPVWVDDQGGYLLFSDMEASRIYKWTRAGQLSVFLEKSGSNGLTIDRSGRMIVAGMTDRAITRVEPDGSRMVLADRYNGKRLNSPNDVVVKSDGAIYFTETGTGASEHESDTVPFYGVYLIRDGMLRVLDRDPQGAQPNGIAFSPDEGTLYVAGGLTITTYDVLADDTVTNARVLIDMSREQSSGSTDGMKVDRAGRIYCSGPGGVWIVSPQGTHLGTIVTPDHIANMAFGDADSKTLYMVGGRSLWQIRVNTAGIRPVTKEKR